MLVQGLPTAVWPHMGSRITQLSLRLNMFYIFSYVFLSFNFSDKATWIDQETRYCRNKIKLVIHIIATLGPILKSQLS